LETFSPLKPTTERSQSAEDQCDEKMRMYSGPAPTSKKGDRELKNYTPH
jgi:hypothetical protein